MDSMVNSFEWCGYNWKCEMEGGRLINPQYPWYWYSLDTIRVCKDDILELYVKHNPREVKYWDGKIYNPVSEVSNMRSLEDFSYGIFSAEIMMPSGKNLSSSFWLSGSGNWPPEIDIEEGWTEESNSWFRLFVSQFPYIKPSWKTTTNVHYLDKNLNKCYIGSRNIPFFLQTHNPADNFIEYKCVWKPDEIIFYANGKEVRRTGKEISNSLTKNLKDPEKGYKMNVIFNVWTETSNYNKIKMYTPMKIRNFKYEPL